MASLRKNVKFQGKNRANDNTNQDELFQTTVHHLEQLSTSAFTTCPSVARFYLFKKKALEEKDKGHQKNICSGKHDAYRSCPYCHMPSLPDTSRVCLLPKMKLTAKVKRLLKRHTEKPGTLGKFQQKMVNDYISGRNRLAIKCLQCQKVVKIPGQSRENRYKQSRQKKTADIPLVKKQKIKEQEKKIRKDIPSAKKQKRKEKKKLMKTLKFDKLVDDDLNAGLKINSSAAFVDMNKDEQDTSFSEGETIIPEDLPNQKGGINSPKGSKKSSNQKPFNRNIQNLLYNDKGMATKRHSSILEGPLGHNVKKSNASQLFPDNKNKRGKSFHQQLGEVLKQEQNMKKEEGSLADFLSSL